MSKPAAHDGWEKPRPHASPQVCTCTNLRDYFSHKLEAHALKLCLLHNIIQTGAEQLKREAKVLLVLKRLQQVHNPTWTTCEGRATGARSAGNA